MSTEYILELLKYILPAFIVFLTAFTSLRTMYRNEDRKRRFQGFLENQKTITPIRLQAYERITLFLERIQIESLIMRLNNPGSSNKQLQADMLKTIRAEFEHNLAQQIYLSSQAWKVIKSAKENTIKKVNTIAADLNPTAPSMQLSTALLEDQMGEGKTAVDVALDFLKTEMSQILNNK